MLAYDKENKAIGISPIDAKKLNAFAIHILTVELISGPRSF
jgi:hypothetical protein